MSKFPERLEPLKEEMNRVLLPILGDERLYTESLNLCCSFMGMLVAKCVDPLIRDETMKKLNEILAYYEAEHRANLDDHRLMVRHLQNSDPKP